MTGCAGLVLAAGAGSRYGQPKASVFVDGVRLVDHAVRCLREGGCDPILVVLGAWRGDVPNAEIVVNEDWAEGLGSSLRAGLLALRSRNEVDSVVVTLVDLPGLTSEAVRRVVDASGDIVVATYGLERGHPVRFARQHWDAVVASAHGDEGARSFLSGRTDVTMVEVGAIADGRDVDRPERTSAPPR